MQQHVQNVIRRILQFVEFNISIICFHKKNIDNNILKKIIWCCCRATFFVMFIYVTNYIVDEK
jgi:hypothetical protein